MSLPELFDRLEVEQDEQESATPVFYLQASPPLSPPHEYPTSAC